MTTKYNYAFEFCAEVVSDLPFDKIPLNELADAVRARLVRVEKVFDREAFNCFDVCEDEGLV